MMSRGSERGYHGNPIAVMEAKITRSREIRDFFASSTRMTSEAPGYAGA